MSYSLPFVCSIIVRCSTLTLAFPNLVYLLISASRTYLYRLVVVRTKTIVCLGREREKRPYLKETSALVRLTTSLSNGSNSGSLYTCSDQTFLSLLSKRVNESRLESKRIGIWSRERLQLSHNGSRHRISLCALCPRPLKSSESASIKERPRQQGLPIALDQGERKARQRRKTAP